MAKYIEGVSGDGAGILKDGVWMSIGEVLHDLNSGIDRDAIRDKMSQLKISVQVSLDYRLHRSLRVVNARKALEALQDIENMLKEGVNK